MLGAVIGGFALTPPLAVIFFGVAAGAIAQVVWVVGRNLLVERDADQRPAAAGVLVGLLAMCVTGLFTV